MTSTLEAIDLTRLPPKFREAVDSIRNQVPKDLQQPKWGIICGSGLSGLADSLSSKVEVTYESIPGFVKSSVEGHKSLLAFGFLENNGKKVPVVACLGRFHTYEGYNPDDVVFPVRVFRCLGAQAVVVTNAAGGLNPKFEVGTIVGMHDHLSIPSFTQMNPLVGHNLSALGPRFPPLSNAYDPSLLLSAFKAADSLGLSEVEMQQGTYAYVMGPTYESRAECRFLKLAGADCVGMSTVPEVIAARHCGMKVLAISLITNKVVTTDYFDVRKTLQEQKSNPKGESRDRETAKKDLDEAANHEEVLEVGRRRAEDVRKIVEMVVCGADLLTAEVSSSYIHHRLDDLSDDERSVQRSRKKKREYFNEYKEYEEEEEEYGEAGYEYEIDEEDWRAARRPQTQSLESLSGPALRQLMFEHFAGRF